MHTIILIFFVYFYIWRRIMFHGCICRTHKLKTKIPTHLVELKANMNSVVFIFFFMYDVWFGSIKHVICTCVSMCFCSISICMNHRNTKIVFFSSLYYNKAYLLNTHTSSLFKVFICLFLLNGFPKIYNGLYFNYVLFHEI